jgi:sugar fermentation stimulation protein A
MRLAADIDPAYAAAFARARAAGVEVMAVTTRISPEDVVLDRAIPVDTGD